MGFTLLKSREVVWCNRRWNDCTTYFPKNRMGCGFFAYSWKLPAHWVDTFGVFVYSWSFFAHNFNFLLAVGAFLLTVGKCIEEGP